jgi:hypothetical protein
VLIGGAIGQTREWPIATVAAPAYQLIPLDAPPIDSTARAALSRAFDVSTALDGLITRARFRPRTTPMPVGGDVAMRRTAAFVRRP